MKSYVYLTNLILFLIICLQLLVFYWDHQRICLLTVMLEHEANTTESYTAAIPDCSLPKVLRTPHVDLGGIHQREQ